MLTQAVAVYFRELREGRGYTQESLATAVDVSKRTVERLERSEGDISVEPFERIITVLGASPEEVNYLATNPSATVEEGKEFARMLLQFDPTPQLRAPQIAALRQDMSSAGIRVYIRTLREQQGIGRKALAGGYRHPDWSTRRLGRRSEQHHPNRSPGARGHVSWCHR
jgi:transcriptional regulator with XRE-family HTH domain